MNHKRGKPKSGRGGCLLCKPQKHQSENDEKIVYHHGFGKIRDLNHAKQDIKEYLS